MGFLGVDRGLREHWIYQDSEYLKVWMEMLFLARYSEEPHTELIDGDVITVNYGEFIFGRVNWSKRLKVGEQRLRTLITKLKKEQMITLVLEHRKCSVYALVNYSKFNHQSNHQKILTQQGVEGVANHQTNQQLTISQPSVNHQSTTKEQGINKDNKDNNLYLAQFELFWTYYPEKKGKAKAQKKWLSYGNKINIDEVMEGTKKYVEYCKLKNRFLVDGSTFVNNQSWNDDWEIESTPSISDKRTSIPNQTKKEFKIKDVELYVRPGSGENGNQSNDERFHG